MLIAALQSGPRNHDISADPLTIAETPILVVFTRMLVEHTMSTVTSSTAKLNRSSYVL